MFWGFIVCSVTYCHCGCVTTKAAHFVFIVLCFLALCLSAVRGVTVSGVFNAHSTCSRRWRAGWLGSALGVWRGHVGGHQHQGGYGKKKWCFTVLGDSNTQCCEATYRNRVVLYYILGSLHLSQVHLWPAPTSVTSFKSISVQELRWMEDPYFQRRLSNWSYFSNLHFSTSCARLYVAQKDIFLIDLQKCN